MRLSPAFIAVPRPPLADGTPPTTPPAGGVADGSRTVPPKLPENFIGQLGDIVMDAAAEPMDLEEAQLGWAKVPDDDKNLLIDNRVPVIVVPRGGLGDALLGATEMVTNDDGTQRPSIIQIAGTFSDKTPLGDVVLHEVGHAVSVLRDKDSSEAAATAYMNKYSAATTDKASTDKPNTDKPVPVPEPVPVPTPHPEPNPWLMGGVSAALFALAMLI